jgi:glutathione peroxidase-family protein
MANQHYTVIEEPQILIDDYLYICEEWDMNLEKFLVEHAGKEIYIYGPSITTDKIKGIVK